MKLVATDIPVIARERIHKQEQKKTNTVLLIAGVAGAIGFGVQTYVTSFQYIGIIAIIVACGFFYWYTTKLDKKVKAYTKELMSQWKAENDG